MDRARWVSSGSPSTRTDRNGFVYLSYTSRNADDPLQSNVTRFESRDGGLTADPSTEVVVMTVPQVRHNHNGGRLVFADGMLWLAFGDGGDEGRGASDSLDNVLARSCASTWTRGSPTRFRRTPQPARRAAEAWAWGFRNPWGWNFDRATGDLWLGMSVRPREELIRGEGWALWWPCCEARLRRGGGDRVLGCGPAGTDLGVWARPRPVVVAGPVQHGAAMPDLDGTALVADYLAGWVRGVRFDTEGAVQVTTLVEDTGLKFGVRGGHGGRGYVLGFSARVRSSLETTRARPHRPSRTVCRKRGVSTLQTRRSPSTE